MARVKMIQHINVPEFLDRGPALNKRQLQLRLGSGEVHFTETPRPSPTPSSHFALEVHDFVDEEYQRQP